MLPIRKSQPRYVWYTPNCSKTRQTLAETLIARMPAKAIHQETLRAAEVHMKAHGQDSQQARQKR